MPASINMSTSYTTDFVSPYPACPSVPGELVSVANIRAWIADENDDDLVVSHVNVVGDATAYVDLGLLELTESRMEHCSFVQANFARALFTDVEFVSCDFSNSDFSEANFTRCIFSSCKLMGADFRDAVFDRVEVRDSAFSYAALTKAKLGDVAVYASDFSHADFAEAQLKRIQLEEVRFVGTSFFRTSLKGVDVTGCQLADIVLSDDMGELRGCAMDLYQAAGIAQRLGVVLKD